MLGGGGHDTLIGGEGNDDMDGDLASGLAAQFLGDDLLDGGEGNDILPDDVSLSNHLEVSIIGTDDKATITNWYAGNPYKVEQFQTSDGQALLSSQVNNLVNAMASFAPPSAGQTTLPSNYAQSLDSVIAANWN